MSYKDLDIKLSYISCGEENIAKAFLVPALKQTKRYRRSVGFFSSGVFGPIIDGIVALARNGGTIDLVGIMEDFDGNVIVFYGSANSSLSAYQNNYEKIRIVKNWVASDVPSIEDECTEFDALWNGINPFVKVYEYKESAKKRILEVVEYRKNGKKSEAATPIKLRDYQVEAISAWVNNKYHGFYVMATGTGKTWTAIYSAQKLLEEKPAMIVICAPYKHLVRQWADDVEKAFPDARLIMVSSENPSWEQQISQEIIRKQYNPKKQIIIISTIASFKMSRFLSAIKKSTEEKLLIVDEAHRFTERPDFLKDVFQYMLSLSATPYSGSSPQKGVGVDGLVWWTGFQPANRSCIGTGVFGALQLLPDLCVSYRERRKQVQISYAKDIVLL